jgi:hypothetical protein
MDGRSHSVFPARRRKRGRRISEKLAEGGFLVGVGRPFQGDFGEERGPAVAPPEGRANGEAEAFEHGVFLRRKIVDQMMEMGRGNGKSGPRKIFDGGLELTAEDGGDHGAAGGPSDGLWKRMGEAAGTEDGVPDGTGVFKKNHASFPRFFWNGCTTAGR